MWRGTLRKAFPKTSSDLIRGNLNYVWWSYSSNWYVCWWLPWSMMTPGDSNIRSMCSCLLSLAIEGGGVDVIESGFQRLLDTLGLWILQEMRWQLGLKFGNISWNEPVEMKWDDNWWLMIWDLIDFLKASGIWVDIANNRASWLNHLGCRHLPLVIPFTPYASFF